MNNSAPRKQLPVHPSLAHLQKQAKRLAKQNPDLKLAQAQQQIAREYGCKNWAELADLVETMRRKDEPAEQIKAALLEENAEKVNRLLLEHPALLTPDLWPTAIYQAKSLSMTRLLLDRGLNPDECSAPRKPLHLAVYQCLPEIVELLIEHGADVNLRNPLDETPLELLDSYEPRAIGDIETHRIRQALLKAGAKEDFYTSIRAGDTGKVRKMLEADPSLAQKDSGFGGPLFPASRSGRPEIVSILLEFGADPNGANKLKNTPLWFAAQSPAQPASNRIAVMKVLLDAGANVNGQCENGTTALYFAAWRGPVEVVEYLLSRGAHNWITDNKGKTPLENAREISIASDKDAIIRLLGEVRILDPIFQSAVKAIDEGDVNGLKSLLRKHPALTHKQAEEEGWFAGSYFRHPTLLHFVANNPYRHKTMPPRTLESMEAILDAGADVNGMTEGENRSTVLALVASCEPARTAGLQIPLIELLIHRGADASHGFTAAVIHSEMEAIACLLRLGARHNLMSAAALDENDALRTLLKNNPTEKERTLAAWGAAIHGKIVPIDILLGTGLDINARIASHPYGPTLLHQAAWSGHRVLADWLIEHGADPTIRDLQYNGTPAGWAEHNNHPELARHLSQFIKKEGRENLQRNKEIDHFISNALSGSGVKARTALKADPSLEKAGFWTALVIGDFESIRDFLEKDSAAATRDGGPKSKWQPLHYLSFSRLQMDSEDSKSRFVKCARLLLEAGADVNAAWEHESWPDSPLRSLYGVTGENNNPELARLLLEHGAMVDDGESIYHAAQHYHLESMEVLREFGVSLGLHPRWKNTPVYFLLGFAPGHSEWPVIRKGIQWLLDHGCDPNIPCAENQESALHVAIRMGHEIETLQMLVRAGADVNQSRKDGKTPMALARMSGMKEVAQFLLKNGAKQPNLTPMDHFFEAVFNGDAQGANKWKKEIPGFPKALDEDNLLTLNRASEKGNLTAINLMLDAGFDIAYKGTRDWGATPLHLAAWNGHHDAVQLLLVRGAPVQARANKPEASTPIVWAAHGSSFCKNSKGNYPALVKALLAIGAIPDENQAAMASPEVAACIREHLQTQRSESTSQVKGKT